MSRILVSLLGAGATVLTLGAVQLLSDQDLIASAHHLIGGAPTIIPTAATVNRAMKADRSVELKHAQTPTRTVSLRLHGLADSSIVLRIPVTQEVRNAKRPALPPVRMQNPRPTIACEPVVSVLTDVAKLLQPGRCLT